jgi:hypothetical protein
MSQMLEVVWSDERIPRTLGRFEYSQFLMDMLQHSYDRNIVARWEWRTEMILSFVNTGLMPLAVFVCCVAVKVRRRKLLE